MTVHFIGAGPGAADLITLRGQKLIESCKVCLYAGSLVPSEILTHCPEDAQIINTAPLDLQLNETLLLQFARVLRCPEDPLFRLVLTLVKSEKNLSSPTKSPIHTLLMLMQESNIDVFKTEKVTEPNFRASLSFNAPTLHLGPKFGSTGSRSSKQQKEAREYTTNTLLNLGDTPVIFTDGSALKNPGPCGAAAVIYPEGI